MKILRGIIIGLTAFTLQACSMAHKDPLAYLPATALSLIQIDAQKKANNELDAPEIADNSPLSQALGRIKDDQPNNEPSSTTQTTVTQSFSKPEPALITLKKPNAHFAARQKANPYITKVPKGHVDYDQEYITPLFPARHYQKVKIKEEDKEYFVLLIKTDQLTKQSVQEKINTYFQKNWQIESISYAPLEYNDEENFTNSALQSLSHTMEYTSDLRKLDKNINYKFDTGLELKSIAIHLIRTYREGQIPDA